MCGACAAKKRPADRERFQRRTAARIAQGLCPKCGKQPPAAGLIHCEPCTEKRNRASRARDARLRAAGKPRRNLEKARAYNKKHSRQTDAERRAQGLCTTCGESATRLAQSALAEARYQAERAEAQFNAVEPANQNVFHNLARKWETCLSRVRACEARLQALEGSTDRPKELTPEQRDAYLASHRGGHSVAVFPERGGGAMFPRTRTFVSADRASPNGRSQGPSGAFGRPGVRDAWAAGYGDLDGYLSTRTVRSAARVISTT